MSNSVVAREVAEEEFNRFCDEMGLEIKTEGYTEEDTKEFNAFKERIVAQIMKGHLVVMDDGCPKYKVNRTPGVDKDLTFKRPTGADLMAGDSSGNANIKKVNMMMASLTGEHVSLFAKLSLNPDYYVCVAIVSLLMGESRPV